MARHAHNIGGDNDDIQDDNYSDDGVSVEESGSKFRKSVVLKRDFVGHQGAGLSAEDYHL